MLGASILERNCAAEVAPVRPAHSIPHCLRSHPNKWPRLQRNVLKHAPRSAGNPAAVHQTPFVFASMQSWREVIRQTNDNGGEGRGGCFKTHPRPARGLSLRVCLNSSPGPPHTQRLFHSSLSLSLLGMFGLLEKLQASVFTSVTVSVGP